MIIPTQPHYLSAKGLELLLRSISMVKRQINPKLRIDGILMTMVMPRTNITKEITATVKSAYGQKIKVFDTETPHSIRAVEATAEGKSIFAYDKSGKVAAAYDQFGKGWQRLARSRETKIELNAYDDLFQTDESRAEAKLSKIRDIPISEIDEFPDHPFKFLMDEDFARFRLTYTHQLADIERLETEQEFSKAQLLEDYIVTEYISTTHSIRAREVIAKYWVGEIVYQDTDLTEDLATICFSDNESYTYLLQMETFRVCGQDEYMCIPFVATVIRLADIIDFDPKRTPSVLFSHLAVKNPVSLSEWKKHQSINAWTILPRKLLFSAHCEHPAIEATILVFCNQIDEELRNGTVILSNLSD